MPIAISCPHCAQSGSAPEFLAGHRLPCPGCRRLVNIPEVNPSRVPPTEEINLPPTTEYPALSGSSPECAAPAPGSSLSASVCLALRVGVWAVAALLVVLLAVTQTGVETGLLLIATACVIARCLDGILQALQAHRR